MGFLSPPNSPIHNREPPPGVPSYRHFVPHTQQPRFILHQDPQPQAQPQAHSHSYNSHATSHQDYSPVNYSHPHYELPTLDHEPYLALSQGEINTGPIAEPSEFEETKHELTVDQIDAGMEFYSSAAELESAFPEVPQDDAVEKLFEQTDQGIISSYENLQSLETMFPDVPNAADE
jgi:hypothetical protein